MSAVPEVILQNLARAAAEVRPFAYAPYSHYVVGAAILGIHKDDFEGSEPQITIGCNVENVSYGLTICAERNAIFAAVARGLQYLSAIAIATADGGTPCGACRQVLAEFAPPAGQPLVVVLTDGDGTILRETTLAALLPDAFSVHPR